jgi:hypothetical protein
MIQLSCHTQFLYQNQVLINSVSKEYDDSQWNGIVEHSITP